MMPSAAHSNGGVLQLSPTSVFKRRILTVVENPEAVKNPELLADLIVDFVAAHDSGPVLNKNQIASALNRSLARAVLKGKAVRSSSSPHRRVASGRKSGRIVKKVKRPALLGKVVRTKRHSSSSRRVHRKGQRSRSGSVEAGRGHASDDEDEMYYSFAPGFDPDHKGHQLAGPSGMSHHRRMPANGHRVPRKVPRSGSASRGRRVASPANLDSDDEDDVRYSFAPGFDPDDEAGTSGASPRRQTPTRSRRHRHQAGSVSKGRRSVSKGRRSGSKGRRSGSKGRRSGSNQKSDSDSDDGDSTRYSFAPGFDPDHEDHVHLDHDHQDHGNQAHDHEDHGHKEAGPSGLSYHRRMSARSDRHRVASVSKSRRAASVERKTDDSDDEDSTRYSFAPGFDPDRQHHGYHDPDNQDHGHRDHDHEDHDHEDHDHEGHDHEGHDHEGHDHEGHDHEGHDHQDHDHEGHGHHVAGSSGTNPLRRKSARLSSRHRAGSVSKGSRSGSVSHHAQKVNAMDMTPFLSAVGLRKNSVGSKVIDVQDVSPGKKQRRSRERSAGPSGMSTPHHAHASGNGAMNESPSVGSGKGSARSKVTDRQGVSIGKMQLRSAEKRALGSKIAHHPKFATGKLQRHRKSAGRSAFGSKVKRQHSRARKSQKSRISLAFPLERKVESRHVHAAKRTSPKESVIDHRAAENTRRSTRIAKRESSGEVTRLNLELPGRRGKGMDEVQVAVMHADEEDSGVDEASPRSTSSGVGGQRRSTRLSGSRPAVSAYCLDVTSTLTRSE